MPNRYYAKNVAQTLPGAPGGKRGSAGPEPPMKEKPAFVSAGVPGKTQKDRSGGAYKCKTHPKSIGI